MTKEQETLERIKKRLTRKADLITAGYVEKVEVE